MSRPVLGKHSSGVPRWCASRACRRVVNRDLSRQLDQLNHQKRKLDAELLLYLSELDRRGLYRKQAYSSLFEFCVTRLACSEEVAYKRVGAARLLRQFPLVLELLADGRIHLTGLMLLKPHLTEANHREWLMNACGKSRRQIEKMIAARLPQPDARTSVRKLPEAKPPRIVTSDPPALGNEADPVLAQPSEDSQGSPIDTTTRTSSSLSVGELELDKQVQSSVAQSTSASVATCSSARIATTESSATLPKAPGTAASATEHPGTARFGKTPAKLPSVTVPPRIASLSGHSYRVVFTASERLKQKLDRACELLSHVIPPNDLPAVIERALDRLKVRAGCRAARSFQSRRWSMHICRSSWTALRATSCPRV